MNDFSAKVTLSSERISLLDPLKITLHLNYPKGYRPDLDLLRTNLSKEFILLSEKVEPSKIEWVVSSETPGKKMVTFYAIPFHAEGKKSVEVISDLYPVEIFLPDIDLSYAGNLAPLHTFSKSPRLSLSKENIRLETPDRHTEKINSKNFPLTTFFIIFSLFLFGYFIHNLFNKLSRLPKGKKEIKETAMNALEKIKSQPLNEQEYFSKVSSIVHRFIGEMYHFNATTKTTQECLQKLSLRKEQQELLKRVFSAADRVKYGKHQPTNNEREEAIYFAKKFITGSRKQT